jgi:polar amino acid transport system substrate-binding protein
MEANRHLGKIVVTL